MSNPSTPTLRGQCIAEFLGTALLIFFGTGCVAALKLGYGGARLYYLARAVTPGEYRVPPSFAESMYSPEIRHQGGDSQMMVIRAR